MSFTVPCILCGSSALAPPSWRCRLCRSHADLYRLELLTDQDRADLRAVVEFEATLKGDPRHA